MENSIQAIDKRVATFAAEFKWVRAAVMILVAVVILMFAQMSDMNRSISEIRADLSAFQVDVQHKFTAVEADVAALKDGQQQIVATLVQIAQQLDSLRVSVTELQ